MTDLSKPKRVFVMEHQSRLNQDAAMQIQRLWDALIEGSELEGSKLMLLHSGLRIIELTGEGLPKVRMDSEGKLVFLTEGEES